MVINDFTNDNFAISLVKSTKLVRSIESESITSGESSPDPEVVNRVPGSADHAPEKSGAFMASFNH